MSVSVIITTHNRLNFLESALISVQKQTLQPSEVIVINDHHDTQQKLDTLLSKFPLVTLIHNFETPGANFSRNIGISEAKGDVIAFLDDDDMWLEKYLEYQVNNIKTNSLGVSYTGYFELWDKKEPIDISVSVRVPNFNVTREMSIAKFCPETTSAVVVKRELLLSHGGFDTSLLSFQDWDMWYRLSKVAKFGVVQKPLIRFRQHLGIRTSVDYTKRLTGLKQILAKWNGELSNDFEYTYTLGCYYANAKKMVMFRKKSLFFKTILSTSTFYKSITGARMLLELFYRLLLQR